MDARMAGGLARAGGHHREGGRPGEQSADARAGPSDLPGGQGAWRDRGNDEHDRATTGQDLLMRYVELRRHTGNEGDRLTPQGAAAAERIRRGRPHPAYAASESTGAARATQTPAVAPRPAGQQG